MGLIKRYLSVPEPVDQDPAAPMFCPESAQIALMRAQAQRDHGMMSGAELARLERLAKERGAGTVKTVMNPFTGEIRKVVI